MSPRQDRFARFGTFEADLRERTLTKSGRPVVVQDLPFRVLARLLRQPGDLVSREEVRDAIWPDGMTVDFEHGLNTAINKLRAALGDSADSPRFVETVPRKGYRFVAPVAWFAEPVEAGTGDRPRRSRLAATRTRVTVAAALIGLVGAGIAVLGRLNDGPSPQAPAPRVRLAVFPFTDLSSTPGEEYLSAGLTEEMINRLGSLAPSQFRVIARRTSAAYAARDRPIAEIGADLGVAYVLEGSVRRSDDRVRISTQLISVEDQTQLWNETYESALGEILNTQRRVAGRIADSLALEVLHVPGIESSVDSEAYEAYLEGLHYRDMLTEDGYRQAIAAFDRALSLDPDFAPALASMSACYCLLAGHGLEVERPAPLMTRTRELATRALALDGNLAEAHGTLGMALLKYEWDWSGAERELRRATEINPSDPMAAVWYSFYLSSQGRHTEAIAQAEKARRSDPIARITIGNLGWQYYEARQYDAAQRVFEEALALFPTFWVGTWGRGLARLRLGDREGAMADLQRAVELSSGSPQALGSLSYAYAHFGRVAHSREILETLTTRAESEYVPPVVFVPIHAELGDLDRAFEWLQKAYEARSRAMVWINVSHDFDALRGDPRFDDIVRRTGLGKARGSRPDG